MGSSANYDEMRSESVKTTWSFWRGGRGNRFDVERHAGRETLSCTRQRGFVRDSDTGSVESRGRRRKRERDEQHGPARQWEKKKRKRRWLSWLYAGDERSGPGSREEGKDKKKRRKNKNGPTGKNKGNGPEERVSARKKILEIKMIFEF